MLRPGHVHVAMVCGSAAPLHCGVEDHAKCLSDALECIGVSVHQICGRDWSLSATRRALRAAEADGCSVVHIQYPAIGFGSSLAPNVAPLLTRLPVVVTLHEFSRVHALRRWASALFAVAGHHLVFTTPDERAAFRRFFPWSGVAPVIPIGANIRPLPRQTAAEPSVVYFGHIKPNRGLEAFIEACRLAHAANLPYHFLAIGSPVPRSLAYLRELQAGTRELPLRWLLDLPSEEVALHLARATVGYLPYPDGASLRRGSLLALLGSGVPVVTTDGPLCPPNLRSVLWFAPNPQSALERLGEIIANPDLANERLAAGHSVLRPYEWPAIAAAHRDLYAAMIQPCPARDQAHVSNSCR